MPKIYPPQHEKHAQKITNFGCLISENFPNGDNLTLALVKRNEIIAALSDAVIVVESSEKGGAHYAIDYAKKIDRLVIAMEPRVEDEELIKDSRGFALRV